ncbi:transcriptional activator, Rgg/GadR/MutR family, C-terminal domain-containing protein [Alkalibacterium gilvum]|uniref:Transcriptional activator, Rgg/GadR/MutR family, C-terminal domain-containing protein n=1 Tax=Alkalibacterium gilvum TaxID=1130080 RepID=A0A1H6UF73_9LACT|nr:Rgg/GadR/MutR family transcriptional regulator [Alkalibacterium gilvum]SEI86810.1 transcriptional activator, Rgg/GadR/MutR family, C-terminal domain-containing protein [Alkalibacterium gilvum]
MDIYEIINKIRIEKNISIKEIDKYSVSKSAFYRYVNGETDLNSFSFLKLLDTLHVSLEEVDHIKNGYGLNDQQKILIDIKNAFESQDIKKLKLLKRMCALNQEKKMINYTHYSSLIDILLARLNHNKINIKNNNLYKYLVHTETWTRYELVMFNNSMFFFTTSANKYLLSRAITSLKRSDSINRLGNESFRLVVNAIIFFIHNDELNEAVKYIKEINSMDLSSDHLYEKIILKMFNNLQGFLLEEDIAIEEINRCIDFLSFIEAKTLDRMFKDLFTDLRKKYNLNRERV